MTGLAVPEARLPGLVRLAEPVLPPVWALRGPRERVVVPRKRSRAGRPRQRGRDGFREREGLGGGLNEVGLTEVRWGKDCVRGTE